MLFSQPESAHLRYIKYTCSHYDVFCTWFSFLQSSALLTEMLYNNGGYNQHGK